MGILVRSMQAYPSSLVTLKQKPSLYLRSRICNFPCVKSFYIFISSAHYSSQFHFNVGLGLSSISLTMLTYDEGIVDYIVKNL